MTPSKTKLELVSPGWTLAVIHMPYRFLYSIPLCRLEVMVITGTGNPLKLFANIFLSYTSSLVIIYLSSRLADSVIFKSDESNLLAR
jgi:hypothetical protein